MKRPHWNPARHAEAAAARALERDFTALLLEALAQPLKAVTEADLIGSLAIVMALQPYASVFGPQFEPEIARMRMPQCVRYDFLRRTNQRLRSFRGWRRKHFRDVEMNLQLRRARRERLQNRPDVVTFKPAQCANNVAHLGEQ